MCTQRNAWNACGARAADACMLFACSVSRRAMEHGARDEYQRHRQDGRAAGARGVQWVQRCMVLCTESCQDARGRAWPCVATRRLHVTCEAERMGAASGGKPSAPNQVRPSRRMCALATRVQHGRVCTHAAATLAALSQRHEGHWRAGRLHYLRRRNVWRPPLWWAGSLRDPLHLNRSMHRDPMYTSNTPAPFPDTLQAPLYSHKFGW